MSEEWLCECDDPEHGMLGCSGGAEDDESTCLLCQEGIHGEETQG